MAFERKNDKISIVAINRKGVQIGLKVRRHLPGSKIYIPEGVDTTYCRCSRHKGRLIELAGNLFNNSDGIIFCMAVGIVVRIIAPHIRDKYTDPAVVAVDDESHFVVSVLSGHEGGANRLAVYISNILAAEPVITTASECQKKFAIGIGCRRGIKKAEVIKTIRYAIAEAGCSIDEIRYVSTIDLKMHERGIREACLELNIPIRIISYDMVRMFSGPYNRSYFVKDKIGVEGVSEPCAILALKRPRLIMPKRNIGRVTVAVARED